MIPESERCDQLVPDQFGSGYKQCARRRGYGPEGAFCKQHDPEAVAARMKQRMAERRAKLERTALCRWDGDMFQVRKHGEWHDVPTVMKKGE